MEMKFGGFLHANDHPKDLQHVGAACDFRLGLNERARLRARRLAGQHCFLWKKLWVPLSQGCHFLFLPKSEDVYGSNANTNPWKFRNRSAHISKLTMLVKCVRLKRPEIMDQGFISEAKRAGKTLYIYIYNK